MTSNACIMVTWVRLISYSSRCDTCLLSMQKMLGKTGAVAMVATEIVQSQQAGVGCISDLQP